MGAEGIKDLLEGLTLTLKSTKLRNDLTGSEIKIKKNAKRLMEASASGIKPHWMVSMSCRCCRLICASFVTLMAVVSRPPTWNDLYRRVINRNSRLRHGWKLKAPEIIARNETAVSSG
jgi:DNA-directed RNA polymerase subunit beta'